MGLTWVVVGSRAALAAILTTSIIACTSSPLARVSTSAQARNIMRVARAADGTIAGVNDHPRHKDVADFEARRAAAHAKGRWLTDELNKPAVVATKMREKSRRAQVLQNCTGDTCGGGGGGGGADSYTTFDDSQLPFDTELDFTDGTSELGEQFVDGIGDGLLTALLPDGTYQFLAGNRPSPAPVPPGGPTCTLVMDGGNPVTFPGPCQKLPKWFCPLAGGVAAFLVTKAFPPALLVELGGISIGVAVDLICTGLTWNAKLYALRLVAFESMSRREETYG